MRPVALVCVVLLASILPGPGCRQRIDDDPGGAEPGASDGIPVGLDPQRMASALAELRVRFAAGDPGAVADCLELGEQVLSYTDDEPAAEVARILIEAGEAQHALDYAERARVRFPLEQGHKDLVFPQAQALDQLGRPREAAEAFGEALGVEPVNPFEYIGSADLWVAAGEFDRAAAAADTGLARYPDDPFLLQARAEVRLRRGDAAGAVADLETLVTRFPDEIGAQVLLMEGLAVLGRPTDLETRARAFDESYSLLAHGAVFVGLARACQGDPAGAAEAWSRAEERIATCVECASDQVELLAWARAQAGADAVAPLER